MKIYIASSWRNEFQPRVVRDLMADGHEVYDFRNPPNKSGFGWEQVDTGWREHPTDVKRYLAMLDHPIAEAGFDADMGALRACDVCVYVGPAGASAGLEFGWASGHGKLTIAYLPAIREQESRAMETIESKVTQILVEQLGVDAEEVTNDATIADDLGADSLDTVEVVMACEEEFGIEIPDADAEKIKTVGDIVRYVEGRLMSARK